MSKPIVVIVGRPNVGKSTLFNKIVGKSAAIVEDLPGVTRDRNYMDAEWEDKSFVVVDTGGFYPKHDDNIFTQIKEQALFAVEEADVIVHLMDGREGLNPHDADLAQLLRQSGKRVLWVVNKVDSQSRENHASEFYRLGIQEVIPVSAQTGFNFDEFMEAVTEGMEPSSEEEAPEFPRVAVVGRPNVGKSTLINALLGRQRMLVSPVPGTTRDSIDSECSYYKRKYTLVDTAGIKRKDKYGYSIERFAMVRTLRAIERCDVALILIDALQGIVSDDQKIAGLVRERYKSAILVFNKWDLVEDPETKFKTLDNDISNKLFFFRHSPVITTSGIEKKRITKLFPIIDEVMVERRRRIATAELNRFVGTLNLPSHKGKRLKVQYMTQYEASPPGFAIFANNPDAIRDNHLRYIESRLRESYGFAGTPMRMKVKNKEKG